MNNNEQPKMQIVSKDGIISARQMVDENFKGLDELIVDMEVTDWYKDLIVECIEGYHAQFSHPQEPQVKSAEEIKTDYYSRFGAGDFQNETDLLDVDAVWEYFEKILASQFKSEPTEELKELRESSKLTIETLQAEIKSLNEQIKQYIKNGH